MTDPTDLDRLQTKIDNLEIALVNARAIGIAIGILVERNRITPDAAFQLLVDQSQGKQRKLHEVAADFVLTGMLPELPMSNRASRRRPLTDPTGSP